MQPVAQTKEWLRVLDGERTVPYNPELNPTLYRCLEALDAVGIKDRMVALHTWGFCTTLTQLQTDSVDKVMRAVLFVIEKGSAERCRPNGRPLVVHALARMRGVLSWSQVNGVQTKCFNKDIYLLGAAYYGLRRSCPELTDHECSEVFSPKVVKDFAELDTAYRNKDVGAAKKLSKLAKRSFLIAQTLNSDGLFQNGRTHAENLEAASPMFPLWEACMLHSGVRRESLAKHVEGILMQRKALVADRAPVKASSHDQLIQGFVPDSVLSLLGKGKATPETEEDWGPNLTLTNFSMTSSERNLGKSPDEPFEVKMLYIDRIGTLIERNGTPAYVHASTPEGGAWIEGSGGQQVWLDGHNMDAVRIDYELTGRMRDCQPEKLAFAETRQKELGLPLVKPDEGQWYW